MTEDYKEKLIKYMTGNIEPEEGANEPQFIDNGLIDENVYNYLSTNLNTTPISKGVINTENLDYIIFYGQYENSSDNLYYGYIYITLKDLTTVALITEYDSGTKFRPFMTLNIDEEGYFYGVDNTHNLYGDNVQNDYRFIMLNKIIQNGILENLFTVKLRQSYFFEASINNQIIDFGLSGKNRCYKKIGSADYYFFIQTTSNNIACLGVVSLTINVGASNEWNILKNTDIYGFIYVSVFPIYNGDNFDILIEGDSSGATYNLVQVLYSDGENPTLVTQNIYTNPTNGSITDLIRIDINNLYVAFEDVIGTDTYQYIYKLSNNSSGLQLIHTFSKENLYLGSQINFFSIDNLLFFKFGWFSSETVPSYWNSYVGMIINDKLYYIDGATSQQMSLTIINQLYITKVYNLITIYTPIRGTQTQKIQLVFNENNYNGLPYEDTNCLIPNSSILYDTDDNIIFARNLYNKTVLGATTTSTVQIPNTMLNDVTIGKNDLISETNLTLTEDTTDITKNIYETVNLNFANSISIRNENDPENVILNPTASARLNGSTTQNNDYDDAQATKVRVNYTDGTNMVIALNPQKQIKMMSKQVARYQFIIYVDRQIENLQIISFDENTVYQTITTLNLELNKTYMITQYVSIGENIQKNDIFYNNNQIYYNGESINYIN